MKVYIVSATQVIKILRKEKTKVLHLDSHTLEDDILPALLLGLKDTNPNIVSETLRYFNKFSWFIIDQNLMFLFIAER